jgi:hypothetical protein
LIQYVSAKLLATALLTSHVLCAQQPSGQAWWVGATFSPRSSSYESLAANQISPDWEKFTILSYAELPPNSKQDLHWMQSEGFMFQTDNFFKSPAIQDRELVGVFRDRAGSSGRFLLVLQKQGHGPWHVAFLHEERGEPGFSVLARKKNALYWGTCMQCSDFSRLRMKSGKFSLDPVP